MFRFWHEWFSNSARRTTRRTRPFRPALESLEERQLLAGNVTTVPVFNSHPGAAASLYLKFDGDSESTWGIYGTRTAASAAAIGYIAGGPVGIPLGLGL